MRRMIWIALALAAVLALAGCGGVTVRPTPPVVTGEVETGTGAKVEAVAWYEPCYRGGCFGAEADAYWQIMLRTANALLLCDRQGQGEQLLTRNPLAQGFREAILLTDSAEAVGGLYLSAVAAGLRVRYAICWDEPDLDGSTTTEALNHRYDSLKAALAKVGGQAVKVGYNFSLYEDSGGWRRLMPGLKQDFTATDGGYCGAGSWMHSVTGRLMGYFEYLRDTGRGDEDIIYIGQVFSATGINPEQIDGPWMDRQCCLLSHGCSRSWDFGGATVTISALPEWVTSRVKVVLWYLLEPKPRGDDAEYAGGNCPGCIDVLAEWARKWGIR